MPLETSTVLSQPIIARSQQTRRRRTPNAAALRPTAAAPFWYLLPGGGTTILAWELRRNTALHFAFLFPFTLEHFQLPADV